MDRTQELIEGHNTLCDAINELNKEIESLKAENIDLNRTLVEQKVQNDLLSKMAGMALVVASAAIILVALIQVI